MSQNPQNSHKNQNPPAAAPQKSKQKIVSKAHHSIVIDMPEVRNYSTGGGHGPEDTLVEGDDKIVTKKWQGYPPTNLNLVGKALPPLPEVAIPRFTGKAEYTTRLSFPNMLWVKLLVCPHPRAKITSIDTSIAEKMPGVAHVLTYKTVPQGFKLTDQIEYQGDIVAMVAADTEDQAEDACEAIKVEYQQLPFASTVAQAMSPNAPQLRANRPNRQANDRGHYGDVDKAFNDAPVIKEFEYYFGGARPVPFQPVGCIAKWDGDNLTFWGTSQGIYPQRAALARDLKIDAEKIRYINKWNGGTFGPGVASERYYCFVAHIAKVTGRPAKLMLPKDQELAQMAVKAENLTKFKVGATKDGKIIACQREFHIAGGQGNSAGEAGGRSELYLHVVPNWKDSGFTYTTNSMEIGPSRSNSQQEYKWAWEQMIDEMAEACGMDPLKFRLQNVQKPGTKVTIQSGGPTMVKMPETENGYLTYDSYAVEEVLAEGAKAIGWDKRNPVAGGWPGRFKHGFGLAMSQHHAGRVGYHEGEVGFEKVLARGGGGGGGMGAPYNAFIELNDKGEVWIHYAQPDSGTNHGTAMATQVAEILGYVTRDHIKASWGDSAIAPPAPGWNSGLTTQLQGGALNAAADNLRHDLLRRASTVLGVDQANLQIREGVISAKDNAQKRTTFAALAKANGGIIKQTGRCIHPGAIGRAMNRGIGCCFMEVEVDTWTGDYKILKASYAHDSGKVVNPMVAEGDMVGSLIQSTQIGTDAIPTDREFPGTRHYSVGFLSYRLPTIMEIPEIHNIFVDSKEPRWFFGCKGFAETSIGAPPGCLANAIYNACGVRVRQHPITREKIMAGLRTKGRIG
jgi:CO/xanthine dehydrogenase Mo-binding subunit